jgi:hypothetical protein
MPENRFHELLGLPEELSDPDYYQLLGVDRAQTDSATIESRFKEQMTRVQHIENPRHKEFVEYLKGELKRARAILTDGERRREYDAELAEDRADELRKILSHMLVDGKLSNVAEVSVLAEGRTLGLDGAFIRKVVDEELEKAGARRVSTNGGATHETQLHLNRKAQEFARQVQDARLEARLAQTRAKIAETHQKKAEEQALAVARKAREAQAQVQVVKEVARDAAQRAKIAEVDKRRAEQQVQAVTKKARDAEALARKAITREHVAAAREKMSEQEKRRLETQYRETETRFQAYVDASNEELAEARSGVTRWQHLAFSYACLFLALGAGGAIPSVAPGIASRLKTALEPHLAKAGAVPHTLVPLVGVAVLLVPLHLLAGRKVPLFVVPLLAMMAFAVVAGVL